MKTYYGHFKTTILLYCLSFLFVSLFFNLAKSKLLRTIQEFRIELAVCLQIGFIVPMGFHNADVLLGRNVQFPD